MAERVEGLVFEIDVDSRTGEARLRRFSRTAVNETRKVERGAKGASTGLEGATKATGGLVGALKPLTLGIGGAVVAFGAFRLASRALSTVLGLLAREMSASSDAAARLELEQQRLRLALVNTGNNVKEASEDILRYAEALELASNANREQILNAINLGLNFGATAEKSKELALAATNLSVALGVDLETATRQIAVTLGGLSGELGERVPEVKAFTEEQRRAGAVIDLINEKFAGFGAQIAGTFSGAVNNAEAALFSLRAEVGGPLNQVMTVLLNDGVIPLILRLREGVTETDNFRLAVIDLSIGVLTLVRQLLVLGDTILEVVEFFEKFGRFLPSVNIAFGALDLPDQIESWRQYKQAATDALIRVKPELAAIPGLLSSQTKETNALIDAIDAAILGLEDLATGSGRAQAEAAEQAEATRRAYVLASQAALQAAIRTAEAATELEKARRKADELGDAFLRLSRRGDAALFAENVPLPGGAPGPTDLGEPIFPEQFEADQLTAQFDRLVSLQPQLTLSEFREQLTAIVEEAIRLDELGFPSTILDQAEAMLSATESAEALAVGYRAAGDALIFAGVAALSGQKGLRELLKRQAKLSAANAIMELAVAFAASTPWGELVFGDPVQHFKSAAAFGAAAAVFGAASAFVGGGGGGRGDGDASARGVGQGAFPARDLEGDDVRGPARIDIFIQGQGFVQDQDAFAQTLTESVRRALAGAGR